MTSDDRVADSSERAERRKLLEQSQFFALLPTESRETLAAQLQRRDYHPGDLIVSEGEEGHSYYLIADGEVEVWARKQKAASQQGATNRDSLDRERNRLVGRLERGQGFGEMALLLGGPRRATVSAATEVVLYEVDADVFSRVLTAHRGMAVALEEEMALRSVATTLGKSSPFASLSTETLRWLAARLESIDFEDAEEIVRQGDPANAFFIIRSGQVDVLAVRPDGTEYSLATLRGGDPFGEQALVTAEPRSATVRAQGQVSVLRLNREDFKEILAQNPDRSSYFAQLTLQRQRPQRIEQWTMQRQSTRSGEDIYILKDATRGRYLKLSEPAAFLWDLMDGERTVRDLTRAYFERYRVLGLDVVLDAMLQLSSAGFLRIQKIETSPLAKEQPNVLMRLLTFAKRWLVHYFPLPDIDGAITILYRYVFRPVYTLPVQLLILALIGAGAVLFLKYLFLGGVHGPPESSVEALAFVIAAIVSLQLMLHELAHAVTCKHFGREVHRAGVGWYFFLPVISVDTSDTWLADKWPRAAVALAGPYTNLLLSGVATLAIPLVHNGAVETLLFQFAAAGYILGLANLNPLMEFDGYYVLMDWLDVPNLRSKAMAFMGNLLWARGEATSDKRHRRIYETYGTLAVIYVLVVLVLILVGYQHEVEEKVSEVLPRLIAAALGWSLAIGMAWLTANRAWRDLRHGIERPHAVT